LGLGEGRLDWPFFGSNSRQEMPMYPAPPGDNQNPRASTRAIKINTRDMSEVAIEGHGEWRRVYGQYQKFRVPMGVRVVIFQGAGVGLDDTHGVAIATGVALPSRLPTAWDAGSAEYDTERALYGGQVRNTTKGVWTYHAGDSCPDYTLLAYNEPGYPAITAPQPASFSTTPHHALTLHQIALHYENTNTVLFWAACTVLR
jgi:hypothetical protein